MPRTKNKSVWIRKPKPVVTDNDDNDSDTVVNLATAEQPESEDVLSQETVEKNRGVLRVLYLLIQKTH